MEIKYFGGNCVRFSTKKVSVVVDDVESLGLKSVVTDKDILLLTDTRTAKSSATPHFLIDGPGEYEVSDVSVRGIPARSHIDEEKTFNSTVYRVIIDELRVAVVGNIYPDLDEDQLEDLGTIDVLIIPIGGNGYTLDGVGAQKIIRKIEPKIIIPVHYDDKALSYEVPQTDLENALNLLAMGPSETLDSLKIKNLEFGEAAKLVVLERK